MRVDLAEQIFSNRVASAIRSVYNAKREIFEDISGADISSKALDTATFCENINNLISKKA